MRRRNLAVPLALAPLTLFGGTTFAGGPSTQAEPARFEIGLIADLPYSKENEAAFPRLMEDLNASPLAFVLHAGDFMSGSTRCDDGIYANRLQLFQESHHPFVFVPGDNDWTDCHRAANGGYDPLGRLSLLRTTFFPADASLGQRTLSLTRQSDQPEYAKFRENVRWTYGGVMFIGLHMPGSNNNLGRTAEMDEEYAERNAANLSWLQQAFDLAKGNDSKGILIVTQANPGFEVQPEQRTGYNDFLAVLEEETLAFGRPVALVHGDTHYFRIDKPLVASVSRRRVEHFTRVETFGAPDSHWVRATIDHRNPNLFRFSPVIVKQNVIDHAAPPGPDAAGADTRTGVFDPPRAR